MNRAILEAGLIDAEAGSKPQPESGAQAPERPLIYPWYVVVILMLAMVVSFINRQVITLLVEPSAPTSASATRR